LFFSALKAQLVSRPKSFEYKNGNLFSA